MNARWRELLRSGCDPRILDWASCPQGKSGGSPPQAPNYKAETEAEAAANKALATQQTWANRPDQYSPWGSTTWGTDTAVDPATGQQITRWSQQEQLNPQLQQALDQQLAAQGARTDLASGFMGRVGEAYQKPFDWTNLPHLAGTPQGEMTGTYGMQQYVPTTTQTTNEPAFAQERQRIEQSLMDRMRPEHEFQENNTRTMLANQGLTPGSAAYNRELQRLQGQQADERFNALKMGGDEQARMQQMLLGQQQQAFGQDVSQGQFFNQAAQGQFAQDASANQQNFNMMQAMAEYQNRLRQQAIAEQQTQRSSALDEYNALMTGQLVGRQQMPTFQSATGSSGPNYFDAAKAQYSGAMDMYNSGQQAEQATNAGLYSLGGAAITGVLL